MLHLSVSRQSQSQSNLLSTSYKPEKQKRNKLQSQLFQTNTLQNTPIKGSIRKLIHQLGKLNLEKSKSNARSSFYRHKKYSLQIQYPFVMKSWD